MYKVVYTKKVVKDVEKIKVANLGKKVKLLMDMIKENPFQNRPRYEKLQANLSGVYSRRINIKHKLVYEVLEEEKIVKILSLWTQYEF